MPRLIANGALRYDSKDLQAGEEFEATEKDAFVLTKVGKATEAGTEDTETRKTRRYNRRDMQVKD
jgi:hypothetical protein